MRIALILNPVAGTALTARPQLPKDTLEALLLEILSNQGIAPEIYYTTPEDPGQEIARRLANEGVDMVVAVGGDGTIHEVASGLIGSTSVLGIIPAGTMNNVARSLGIPDELEGACAVLINGEARLIDVGCLNGRTFLEVAGVGFEAALFPAASNLTSRGFRSTLWGAVSGLYTLFRFRAPHVQISFDNEKPRTYRALQVTICNAPYYGPRLRVASGIFMDDGWLDAVLYTDFSKKEYIRHAISISQGRRPFTPKVLHRRTRALHIKTDEPVEIQADGVAHGHTPVQITIVPHALNVQVPQMPGPGLHPLENRASHLYQAERKQTYA